MILVSSVNPEYLFLCKIFFLPLHTPHSPFPGAGVSLGTQPAPLVSPVTGFYQVISQATDMRHRRHMHSHHGQSLRSIWKRIIWPEPEPWWTVRVLSRSLGQQTRLITATRALRVTSAVTWARPTLRGPRLLRRNKVRISKKNLIKLTQESFRRKKKYWTSKFL